MAASTKDKDLRALQRLLSQADLTLGTITDPHPSIARSRELLKAAAVLTKDIASRPPEAVALGAIGGRKTAERGAAYYSKIARMRKERKGGRPKSE